MVHAPGEHLVRFYDRDDELVAELAGVAVEALTRGEPLLCVATEAHRRALEQLLGVRGIDVAAVAGTGAYRPHDAAQTLALFMLHGRPDARLFEDSVGALVDDAGSGGRHVQVYGEMVALLWERGEHAAAVELEHLWNDLARSRDFSLLCAYPTAGLETASLRDTNRACAAHSAVLPPASYGSAVVSGGVVPGSLVLVPVPEAVPTARRFVGAALAGGVPQDVLDDAQLVVSELATNAVRHATSAFRVSVRRMGTGVRVAVQDDHVGPPRERRPVAHEHGGRGIGIVGKVASRWGYDRLADGKVVWAELFGA